MKPVFQHYVNDDGKTVHYIDMSDLPKEEADAIIEERMEEYRKLSKEWVEKHGYGE